MKWDQTVNKFQLNVLYIHVHENLGEYVHRFIFVFSLLLNMTMKGISAKRNWVFATNSEFITPISLELNVANLWYFRLTLFDLIEFIAWNIKGLQHQVYKIRKFEFVAKTYFFACTYENI